MLFALVSAALAADPLVIEGVEELNDAPTVWAPVAHVDFDGVNVNAKPEGPQMTVTWVVNHRSHNSLIVLRDSFFPEMERSVHAIN